MRPLAGAPGAVIGRMYVKGATPSAGAPAVGTMPLYFVLMQACTRAGTYPTAPGQRLLPDFTAP